MMKTEGNLITEWLNENRNPEIDSFIQKNLAITEKVRHALQSKGWTRVQLAEAMGKSPSEVSKLLSGMHNLTLKSIIKMEYALGVSLIDCEPINDRRLIPLGEISFLSIAAEGARAEYTTSTEEVVYEIAM